MELLSASKRTVLKKLAREIPEDVNWCLFGSLNSALQGVDVNPDDIDIWTTEDGAEKIRETFSKYFVDSTEVGTNVKSSADRYIVKGEEIEVIYRSEREPLLKWDDLDIERSELSGLPILTLEELSRIYRKIGHEETAGKLEKYSKS